MTTIQTGLMITTTMRAITTISEINKIQQEYFTSILLDKVKIAWYNNKAVARERESRGQMNERKWKSGSGDRQRPVEFVQEKFTWQKRESVIEWIGWLFWTGCRGWKENDGLNISSQIVYLTKTTECDKIEKLVTARRKEKKTIWASVHKMFTWQKLLNVI